MESSSDSAARPSPRAQLSALAEYLRQSVEEKHFDMGAWKKTKQPSCGFAGCAIGHGIEAGLLPRLKLEPVGYWQYPEPIIAEEPEPEIGGDGFKAVAKALEISEEDAFWLFDSYEYRDEEAQREDPVRKEEVAERIEEFLSSHIWEGE